MEFISTEAEEDESPVFSDEEDDEKITDELDDFIDGSTQPRRTYVFTGSWTLTILSITRNFTVRHVILLKQFMRTIFLFTDMKTNSQNFTIQKTDSMFLLTNSKALKDLLENF